MAQIIRVNYYGRRQRITVFTLSIVQSQYFQVFAYVLVQPLFGASPAEPKCLHSAPFFLSKWAVAIGKKIGKIRLVSCVPFDRPCDKKHNNFFWSATIEICFFLKWKIYICFRKNFKKSYFNRLGTQYKNLIS